MSFDMATLVYKDMIPALKVLGSKKWLEVTRFDAEAGKIEFCYPAVKYECPEKLFRQMRVIRDMCKEAAMGGGMTFMYAMSRCIANGPKCFEPTFEQCESMLEVEARIPIRDYKQVFPQLIVSYPAEFLKLIAERHNRPVVDIPKCTLLHHEDNFGTFACRFRTCEYACPFYVDQDGDCEDKLTPRAQIDPVNDWEPPIAVELERVAVNLSYLLMFTGYKTNDAERRRVQKKRPDLADRTAVEVTLAQEIVVRQVQPHGEHQGGSHASPKPHWRRGHWRTLDRGTESQRLVLVRPTFVRGEGVDPSQTQVLMRSE